MKLPIIRLSCQVSSHRSLFLGWDEAARKKNSFPCKVGKEMYLDSSAEQHRPEINLSQTLQLLCSLATGQVITSNGAEMESRKTTS